MSDIDQKIRQALNEEDRKEMDRLSDNYSPFDLAALPFKGNQRATNMLIWLIGFVSFLVLLYCGYQYFAAEELKESLSWALGILLSGMSIVIAKVIAWQIMQTQVLIREIKRLELRILSVQKQGATD